jgi:predicted amidohydrolase YtcJ
MRTASRPLRRSSPMIFALLLALLAGCESKQQEATDQATEAVQVPVADTIYFGGDILTMDAAMPRVQAVAVKDGRVMKLGDTATLQADHADANTRLVDLAGRTLLPGFIDGHSHLGHGLMLEGWANVSAAPVGSVDSIASLLDTLKLHAQQRGIAAGQWIQGYGYDADGLAESRHVTRDDIDAAFPDNPVMLLHVSGHGMVLNSAAFALAGITAATPTPEGGVIVRKPGSNEPEGLLMETAAFPVYAQLPRPSPQQQLEALVSIQQQYARNGYTTIQDGASDPALIALLRSAVASDVLQLDVVALPIVAREEDLEAALQERFGSYEGRLKLAGIKVITDGSPQGRTAFFSEAMLVPGPGGETQWRGEPFLAPDIYQRIFARVHAAGIAVWTHANGDAAIDMVIAAHEQAGASRADGQRNVVVHSQFVRPDQLDAYARLGIMATFFSNHAFYWGDVHLRNLGEQRAFFLSPLRSAHERGVRYSNHTDYAVTPLDPAMMLWTAVTRQSRSGVVIGPDERIAPLRALEAITIDAAALYAEEEQKGSIVAGKLADFVVLDANPLEIEPDALRQLRVVATIKENELVYGTL